MIHHLFHYYQPYRNILAGVIIGTFVTSALSLVFPVAVRDLMNRVLPAGDMQALFIGTMVLLLLYVINFILQYGITYYGHVMSVSMEHDMRRDMFRHMEELPFQYFDNERTGQLLSRITNDITEISDFSFRGPNDILICAVTMMGTLVIMMLLNWKLALGIGFLLIVKAVQTVHTNYKMKLAFRKNRVKLGEISGMAEESLSGIRLTKAFAQEPYELERFRVKSDELCRSRCQSYRLMAMFSSGMNFFTNFINVAVLLGGGVMIVMAQLALSDLVAFLLYVGIFMRPVFRLTVLAEVYQRGMAGLRRFEEVMETENTISDPACPAPFAEPCGEIAFRHVTFSYDGVHEVLQDLDLTMHLGQTTALVGETGCGKSTLVNLLLRFYDPVQGTITLDGHDLRDYDQRELRRHIGIVQQDVFLFSDTIADNIAYGRPGAAQSDIEAAASRAAANTFIRDLPQGYETIVGERGVKLSGGQRQRIALARLFLKDPPVLVLDEATSSLDTQTEEQIRKTLERQSQGKTTIIIAHRLSTVRNADCIIVLDHGTICEQGTHDELLAKKGKYYQLYEAQRKKPLSGM
jgi:ATP-binding cassette subfamily B protein